MVTGNIFNIRPRENISSMIIENIVISHSHWVPSDISTLFSDESVQLSDAETIQDLVVELGIFPSKSKARHAGRVGVIPLGWSELKASKKRKLWIWNPVEFLGD